MRNIELAVVLGIRVLLHLNLGSHHTVHDLLLLRRGAAIGDSYLIIVRGLIDIKARMHSILVALATKMVLSIHIWRELSTVVELLGIHLTHHLVVSLIVCPIHSLSKSTHHLLVIIHAGQLIGGNLQIHRIHRVVSQLLEYHLLSILVIHTLRVTSLGEIAHILHLVHLSNEV